jgi:hypothetical protein
MGVSCRVGVRRFRFTYRIATTHAKGQRTAGSSGACGQSSAASASLKHLPAVVLAPFHGVSGSRCSGHGHTAATGRWLLHARASDQKPSSSRHWRTFAGSMRGVSSLTAMTGSPSQTLRLTPTMESALRRASPTNSSTVLPYAAATSVARWYSSSSTVNVDMYAPSSLTASHT